MGHSFEFTSKGLKRVPNKVQKEEKYRCPSSVVVFLLLRWEYMPRSGERPAGRTRCELNFEKLTISPITFTFDSMAREQTALVTPQSRGDRQTQQWNIGGEGGKNANKEVVGDRLSKL